MIVYLFDVKQLSLEYILLALCIRRILQEKAEFKPGIKGRWFLSVFIIINCYTQLFAAFFAIIITQVLYIHYAFFIVAVRQSHVMPYFMNNCSPQSLTGNIRIKGMNAIIRNNACGARLVSQANDAVIKVGLFLVVFFSKNDTAG